MAICKQIALYNNFINNRDMDKREIGLNAGKVWQLLSNNAKWDYGTKSLERLWDGWLVKTK